MKNRLGLSSKEFLDTHTVSEFDTTMGLPTVLLKMKEDSRRSCFFVSSEGCTIYEDRPGACRVYPLGRAAQKGDGTEGMREKYFVVKEPHCRGFEEEKTWRIDEWLGDQEVDTYNEMNDHWAEVTTSRHPDRYKGLDEKKMQMFFMASYNLDSFREFVFSSKFFDLFEVDRATQEEIRNDEVALMKFACLWMRFSLFGESTIQVKSAVMQAKKEEAGKR
jgi:Fe-S-cluster containining protein